MSFFGFNWALNCFSADKSAVKEALRDESGKKRRVRRADIGEDDDEEEEDDASCSYSYSYSYDETDEYYEGDESLGSYEEEGSYAESNIDDNAPREESGSALTDSENSKSNSAQGDTSQSDERSTSSAMSAEKRVADDNGAEANGSKRKRRRKAERSRSGDTSKLVCDGGVQMFPPKVLPVPSQYAKEVRALRRDDEMRQLSMGYLSVLSDRILLKLLRYVSVESMLRLSETSRWLYVYATHEEYWKRAAIKKYGGDFSYHGSWRRACLLPNSGTFDRPEPQLHVRHFYSPRLYGDWYRAHVPLHHFFDMHSERREVARRRCPSFEEFERDFLTPNVPVVIEGALTKWRANESWTMESLLRRCGNVRFKTDEVDDRSKKFKMRLKEYARYMALNHDEDPIYLFDPDFWDRNDDFEHDYAVPDYFPQDWFRVLGEEDRPDYKWLVIGPPRSGSPFHVDPYRTSAWNAVVHGKKRWLLYAPDEQPYGVDIDSDSEDDLEYDADEPIKYLVDHYQNVPSSRVAYECITGAGDLIFVPSGWWHCVLNLEETVAVTQNFVGAHNAQLVDADLRKKSNKKIFKKFRHRLAEQEPSAAAGLGYKPRPPKPTPP